jgi:hypothetical protein
LSVAPNHFGRTVLGTSKDHRQVEFVSLEGEFRANGVFKGLSQGFGGIEHSTVVLVGHRHGGGLSIQGARRRVNGHATLTSDTTNRNLSQAVD